MFEGQWLQGQIRGRQKRRQVRKKERGLVEKKKWSVPNLARYQQAMRRVRGEREAEEVRAKEEEGSQQVDFFWVGWVGGHWSGFPSSIGDL